MTRRLLVTTIVLSLVALLLGSSVANAATTPTATQSKNTIGTQCGKSQVVLILDQPTTNVTVECPPSQDEQNLGLVETVNFSCSGTDVEVRVVASKSDGETQFQATIPCVGKSTGVRYLYSDGAKCTDGTKYGVVVSSGPIGGQTYVGISQAKLGLRCPDGKPGTRTAPGE